MTDSKESQAPLRPRLSIAARIWSVFMGLAVAAMGLAFCGYLWGAYQKAKVTDDWIERPCEVVSALVDDTERNRLGGIKYILVIQYRYELEGEGYLSDRIRRRSVASNSPKKIDKKLAKYPVGFETVCYVNPAKPSEAVLETETKAPLYSIWFPALFVVGGFGMITAAFRRHPKG